MIEKLKQDLLNARSENRQLIDALRSLHSRFNSLQMHADKQSELLLGDGEELRDAKQRLVSVQRELDRKKEECERLQKELAKFNGEMHGGESGRRSSGSEIAGGGKLGRHTSGRKRSSRSVTERFIVLPIGGKHAETHYPVGKEVMTIGRSRDNDITVDSGCVSRVHARIFQKGSSILIEDTGSKNGIMVNSEPVVRYELKHGDTFTIGNQEFELFDGDAEARAVSAPSAA